MSLPETGLCASQRGTMYASAALLRPGIAVGAYPQREDIRDSWLDRTAAGATGNSNGTHVEKFAPQAG